MTGDEKWVQICLQQLKLYDGAIDGQFGPKSQAALKQFELMYQLPPTGVIDQINCWSLAIATCTKNIIPSTP
jgi:peptidoglycan hydrolase-like protein with peptidoglycan-binding domain